MIYPKFLTVGGTIGVCAPSDGIVDALKLKRVDNAYCHFTNKGYFVQETESVRNSQNGRSAPFKTRASEIEELFLNSEVDWIVCATGGDFLMECLPAVNWNVILQNPKWIQGYSDPTGLLFFITTSLDIATIYGSNIGPFGMEEWHESLQNNLDIVCGKSLVQHSFSLYEGNSVSYETGLEGYHLDSLVSWKNIIGGDDIQLEGRMIGGCIDVLLDLFGTPFDHVREFTEKYKNDGIIWYFDNAELSNDQLVRGLWKLKVGGWFQYTKGILFGRSFMDTSYYDISLEDSIRMSLEELNCPIIMDVDFGHVAPRVTIISGAMGIVHSSGGRGSIEFVYR